MERDMHTELWDAAKEHLDNQEYQQALECAREAARISPSCQEAYVIISRVEEIIQPTLLTKRAHPVDEVEESPSAKKARLAEEKKREQEEAKTKKIEILQSSELSHRQAQAQELRHGENESEWQCVVDQKSSALDEDPVPQLTEECEAGVSDSEQDPACQPQSILSACQSGNAETIKHVLEAGGAQQLTVQDRDGRLPIHIVCKYGNVESIKVVLAAGGAQQLTEKASDGDLPIHIVCESGNAESIKVVLKAGGAQQLIEKNRLRRLPIHIVCESGNAESIKLVLEAGGAQQLTEKAKFGTLPIHQVCQRGNAESIKLVLAAGGAQQLTVQNHHGRLPIHHVCYRGNAESIKVVLEAGGAQQLTVQDRDGILPIHHVCCSGNEESIKVVLAAGGAQQLTVQDRSGDLPIHHVCKSENAESIKVVLAAGGAQQLTVQNHHGNLPIHHVCYSGNAKNIKIVLEAGGAQQLTEKNRDGQLPIHCIIENGRIINVLEDLSGDQHEFESLLLSRNIWTTAFVALVRRNVCTAIDFVINSPHWTTHIQQECERVILEDEHLLDELNNPNLMEEERADLLLLLVKHDIIPETVITNSTVRARLNHALSLKRKKSAQARSV